MTPQEELELTIRKLRAVYEAARGLCMGYDWNNGTAAKACGYRRKLLSAVNAIEPVPDFEGKYKSAHPRKLLEHDTARQTSDSPAQDLADRPHADEQDEPSH